MGRALALAMHAFFGKKMIILQLLSHLCKSQNYRPKQFMKGKVVLLLGKPTLGQCL